MNRVDVAKVEHAYREWWREPQRPLFSDGVSRRLEMHQLEMQRMLDQLVQLNVNVRRRRG